MDFWKKFKDHFVPSERNVYRPHVLRKPWLIFFVAIVLTSEGVFLLDVIARQSAFDFVAAVLPGEVIALTNDQRTQNAVASVTENHLLDQAAQAKAEDMAAHGYFSHVGPDGKAPWEWVKEAGYVYQNAGENLAVHFVDSSDVVNAWMESPSHRANIVKPVYTEIGVGVAQGMYQGEPATYVVQYFGTPLVAAAAEGVSETLATESSLSNLDGERRVAGAPQPSQVRVPAAEQMNPDVRGATTQSAQTSLPDTNFETPVTVSHSEPTPTGSFVRTILQNESPGTSVAWVLGGVTLLLVIGLVLTFFVHIQIQPTDMLISGSVVVAIALSFLVLNSYTPFVTNTTQPAAVFGALPSGGGFITASGAQIDTP
jgi:hypothetical protein